MNRRTFVLGGLVSLLSSCFKPINSPFKITSKTETDHQFHFPNLDVWSLDGELHQLKSYYDGNPLLMHLVQYGCTPCKEFFPILNQLTSQIEVLGMYSGWGEDFAKDKKEWLEQTHEYKMNFPSVLIANRGDIILDRYCREKF